MQMTINTTKTINNTMRMIAVSNAPDLRVELDEISTKHK